MEFSIKLNEQDICATKPETVASLFMVLREISLDSMKVKEQKADEMTDTVVGAYHKKQAQRKAETTEKVETPKAKADEPKAKKETAPKEEPKKETAPAKEEPKEEPKEELEKAEEPAAAEAATETPDEEKTEIDREAIVEKIKKIAFEGKAEGKPKKMKALLAEYGVEKLPDLPDGKLPEFLKKVEAL